MLKPAYDYALSHGDKLMVALQEHLVLVAVPLILGLLLGLPLGLWSARSRAVALVALNGFNGLRVIPSLAVLFLAIPLWGLSRTSALLALTLLVIPPILISTEVAFRTLDPAIREAAVAMGMEPRQILTDVEIPLALPVIVAGIKTATIEVIASATLAAFIGAGGLGSFMVLGFAVYDPAILLVGAVPVAVLALGVEVIFSLGQRSLRSYQGQSPRIGL